MSPPIGWKPKKHDVACMDCKKQFQLCTHWKTPRCPVCRKKHWRRENSRWYRELRQQARRYRILLHHLGWPDTDQGFAEMLAEIKASPMAFRKHAEERAAKVDATWERKTRKRNGSSVPEGALA